MSQWVVDFKATNEKLDLVGVAGSLGLPVRVVSGVPFTVCPAHNDDPDNPNLALYHKGAKWSGPHVYCYRCKWKGSGLDFIARTLGTDIKGAATWATGRNASSPSPARVYVREREDKPVRNLRGAVDWARERLWSSDGERARDYLEGRGLLGVAAMLQLGLWGEDSSAFSNRLLIPHLTSLDEDAPVWFAKARSLDPGCEPRDRWRGTPGARSSTFLLGVALEHVAAGIEEVWLCEGETDALSLVAILGTSAPVVAVPGVTNFRPEDFAQFAGCRVNVIMDDDPAGREARVLYRIALGEKNCAPVDVVPFVDETADINDMLVKLGSDEAERVIRRAARAARPPEPEYL